MVISPNKWELDVQAYLNTCNITSATPRKQIRDFAAGVNDLGLWNSMVCWPLRSSQNAGTGTTAYSLGGLGTLNGTLVNGPTWGSSGLEFTSTQFAHAAITALPQDVTLLFCGRGDGTNHGLFPMYFGVQKSNAWAANEIRVGGNGLIGASHRNSNTASSQTAQSSNPFSSSTSFAFVSGTGKVQELLNFRHVSAGTSVSGTAATAGTATLDRMQLNGRWDGSASALGVGWTCAFAVIVTPNINGSEASFYTLYKTTLGTGLGLP